MTILARSPLRPGVTCTAAPCRRGPCGLALGLERDALDRLMPMHLFLSMEGEILHAGPTAQKLRPGETLVGSNFFQHFDLRRPRGRASVEAMANAAGQLHLALRDETRAGIKGQALPLSCRRAVLINLSFGISVTDAVRRFQLTSADFSGTDLAIEMLFLVEAHAAALSESKRLNSRLQAARLVAEQEAATDRLTGLRNRRAMEHVLARLIGQGTPFGLMHLDLDRFKAVNDDCGHDVGDAVLKVVAERLSCVTRDGDTVARFGGDEFVLILHGLANVNRLSDLAARIVACVEEPISVADVSFGISASIGVTASGLYARPDATRMLKDADVALYAAKHEGGAGFAVAEVEGG
ncbi:MAG: GGDEF domain-containing protein [Pseudomonadota bacterium]